MAERAVLTRRDCSPDEKIGVSIFGFCLKFELKDEFGKGRFKYTSHVAAHIGSAIVM